MKTNTADPIPRVPDLTRHPTPGGWYDLIRAVRRVRREIGADGPRVLLSYLMECLETTEEEEETP